MKSTGITKSLTQEEVNFYRENGFVRIRQVLSADEVDRYRDAALDAVEKIKSYHHDDILNQRVNLWRESEAMRSLTLHPKLAHLAGQLSGVPLRLWHDQLLIKDPGKSAATEFHQDQPYWPHKGGCSALTAWVALVDVPVERGCLSFIPGTHRIDDLPRHELSDARSLFRLRPELAWEPRVTLPLRAGDCTFHHGRTAHYAHPNQTGEPRIAHAVIYTDAQTIYTGQPHVVTDPLSLEPGQVLDDGHFPLTDTLVSA